jgi:signal transduction histidine kinase
LREVGPHDLLEVARFTVEFNQLAGQLALARAAEERLRTELEERVAARTAELAASNRELESFSYSVSHDLRAPLRAVDGFAHALVEEAAPRLQAEDLRMLERIRQAAGRMSALIDDLLELSRVSRLRAQPRVVDVSAMAEDVRQELTDSNPQRSVMWQIAPGIIAWADPVLLRVVLVNLLGNAWKYSGKVAIPLIELRAVAALPGTTAFAIVDNGVGFDQAFAHKLFTPFQRLHRVDEFPGTGIGLATVARVVQRQGGTVTVEATVDRGAAFTVQLPFPANASAPA